MFFDKRLVLLFLTSFAAVTISPENGDDETISAVLTTQLDNDDDETTSAVLTTQSDNGDDETTSEELTTKSEIGNIRGRDRSIISFYKLTCTVDFLFEIASYMTPGLYYVNLREIATCVWQC